MNRNAVSLIETLARHPLHYVSDDVAFATSAIAARYGKLWAQMDRAVATFPRQAKETAHALRKQAEDYRTEDAQRSEEARRAAQTIEWHAMSLGLLA